MSGVYIPGMEMPTSCNCCRFAVDGWCYAHGKPNIEALANEGRTNFCPLVPIPPHGDLIDRDALMKRMWEETDCMISVPATFVRDSPTIIPAEENEG